MPKFGEIAWTRGDGILGWMDIATLDGAARESGIAAAARGMWHLAMSTLRDDMTEAVLLWPGDTSKPEATTDLSANGLRGFLWTGALSHLYWKLWPDMPSAPGNPLDETSENVAANTVRRAVGNYLKRSKNIVNIVHGGHRFAKGRIESVWFIAAEYDGTKPPNRLPMASSQSRAEARVTATEAGDTREPAPVMTTYRCRRGCEQLFASPEMRASHEVTHITGGQGKVASRGIRCGACGVVISNEGNLRIHEESYHPEVVAARPWACFVDGGEDQRRFSTKRGLSYHLGGAHALPEAEYARMLELASAEAARMMAEATGYEELRKQEEETVPETRAAAPEGAGAPQDLEEMLDRALARVEELMRENEELRQAAATKPAAEEPTRAQVLRVRFSQLLGDQ